jgi:hypothetical protein
MLDRLDNYDWEQAFTYSSDFTREDVVEIIGIDNGENDSSNWIGVFKLANGKYGFLSAGCEVI